MLSLAYPWALLLTLAPVLLQWKKPAAQTVDAPVFPVGHWLSDLPGVTRQGNAMPRWQTLILLLAWALLVLALARPQHIGEQVQMPVTGRDLMLVVDISPSMEEQDMVVQGRSINRLQAVKRVLNDFIARRGGDRLGLILFGTEPYVQAPLTFDLATLETLLQESGIGMAGRATAIGDAVGLATKRLRDRPQQQRVAVLLTDGANTAGEITPDKDSSRCRHSPLHHRYWRRVHDPERFARLTPGKPFQRSGREPADPNGPTNRWRIFSCPQPAGVGADLRNHQSA